MNSYERLIDETEIENINFNDTSKLPSTVKGLYINIADNDVILINSSIDTCTEKRCILAEELGHYYTTYGNIHDQTSTTNIKLEKLARNWGYEKLVSFEMLIQAFEDKVQGEYSLAEYLEITPCFLCAAVAYYHHKYGEYHKVGVYTLFFNPLGILKIFE